MSETHIEKEPKTYTQLEVDELQATWTAERDTFQQTLEAQQVEYAFYKHAGAAGIANPESLISLINLSEVTKDESGAFQGLDAIVQRLADAAPKSKPREIGGPSNPPITKDRTKDQLLAEAADKARRSGRAEDRAAYSALKQKLTN